MTDTTPNLVETRMPSAGTRGWLGLSAWEATAGLVLALAWLLYAAIGADVYTLLAAALGLSVDAALFLWSPAGTTERLIHLGPRYAGRAVEWAGGQVDVHTREVEGRHYTDRPTPGDVPVSPHFGAMWRSHFDWHGRRVGLLIEGGTRGKPWRAAHMIVVQVSGQDPLLLESANHQEAIRQRWASMQDTQLKQSLGLTAIEEVVVSRPLGQGEGAHWQKFLAVLDHQPIAKLRERYPLVQLEYDKGAVDRRVFLVFRSGGTLGSWMKARHRGSSRAGVEEHFGNVLDKLPAVAEEAGLHIVGVLSDDQLDNELRLMVDPASAPVAGYRRAARDVRIAPKMVAPVDHWKVHRDHIEVNGAVMATYRVSGWPDVVRGSSLLAEVLQKFNGYVRIGLPIGPEDPKLAKRINDAHQTNTAAKVETKVRKGGRRTEADMMAAEKAEEAEKERERHKHHPAKYHAYFTLIEPHGDVKELHRFEADLSTLLDARRVDIMCCYNRQGRAVGYTGFFCWGLGF